MSFSVSTRTASFSHFLKRRNYYTGCSPKYKGNHITLIIIGNYFLEALSADIESLRIFAKVHSIHFDRYYRLVSKKFPFAIYYRIEENEVRIRKSYEKLIKINPAQNVLLP